jgi:hypothetical protein
LRNRLELASLELSEAGARLVSTHYRERRRGAAALGEARLFVDGYGPLRSVEQLGAAVLAWLALAYAGRCRVVVVAAAPVRAAPRRWRTRWPKAADAAALHGGRER